MGTEGVEESSLRRRAVSPCARALEENGAPAPASACLGAAFALAVLGCGGGSEPEPPPAVPAAQRGVIETVDDLQTASRRGDGVRICSEIFTRDLAESVASAAKTGCAQEVRSNLFSPDTNLAVGREIRIDRDRATVTVMEQDGKVSTLLLRREAGGWRIDRVTPSAQDAK